jgi:hypothetical protein
VCERKRKADGEREHYGTFRESRESTGSQYQREEDEDDRVDNVYGI